MEIMQKANLMVMVNGGGVGTRETRSKRPFSQLRFTISSTLKRHFSSP